MTGGTPRQVGEASQGLDRVRCGEKKKSVGMVSEGSGRKDVGALTCEAREQRGCGVASNWAVSWRAGPDTYFETGSIRDQVHREWVVKHRRETRDRHSEFPGIMGEKAERLSIPSSVAFCGGFKERSEALKSYAQWSSESIRRGERVRSGATAGVGKRESKSPLALAKIPL